MTKLQHNIARANILAKLKQQVAGADYTKLPIETPYHYPEIEREQQISQFITHLTNNHAQVIKTTQAALAEQVADILNTLKIENLLYGKDSTYSQEIEQLNPTVKLQAFDFTLEDKKEHLFNNTPASITSSHASIAATGCIVLWPSKNEPRTMSLIPPVHIVIVDANDLYSDFASLVKAQQWQNKLPTNVLLISGPSKTADIQQTLAYGAHGPEKLFVLLLNS
ncbi:MAG: lactate utilization protein [Colwellia sp.]|nr:lactate utilization protein [Colwellia sp.]MCW8863465.1 lactate utilization protein [Colwellia sp.]MCW9079899.1 lactate utilization protein [Colwellia sp.]